MLAHLGSGVTGALNGGSHMEGSAISRRTERRRRKAPNRCERVSRQLLKGPATLYEGNMCHGDLQTLVSTYYRSQTQPLIVQCRICIILIILGQYFAQYTVSSREVQASSVTWVLPVWKRSHLPLSDPLIKFHCHWVG